MISELRISLSSHGNLIKNKYSEMFWKTETVLWSSSHWGQVILYTYALFKATRWDSFGKKRSFYVEEHGGWVSLLPLLGDFGAFTGSFKIWTCCLLTTWWHWTVWYRRAASGLRWRFGSDSKDWVERFHLWLLHDLFAYYFNFCLINIRANLDWSWYLIIF